MAAPAVEAAADWLSTAPAAVAVLGLVVVVATGADLYGGNTKTAGIKTLGRPASG